MTLKELDWEKIAASTAIDAFKERHYAKFSSIIYKSFEKLSDNYATHLKEFLEELVGEEEKNQQVSEYYSGYNQKRREIKDKVEKFLE